MIHRAYLDIETTGFSWRYNEITVLGITIEKGRSCKFTQLYEDDLYEEKLLKVLKGVNQIYTYNGSRFDFPFIKNTIGLDIEDLCDHTDLMYFCWKKNLNGGLKAVEKKLGIKRKIEEVDGYMAVKLWWDYYNNNDEDALKTLLEYNKEDVMNLRVLRRKLGAR
ncbi:ribonuclease H-like domain-containing protein [Planctomycetota bacterium]